MVVEILITAPTKVVPVVANAKTGQAVLRKLYCLSESQDSRLYACSYETECFEKITRCRTLDLQSSLLIGLQTFTNNAINLVPIVVWMVKSFADYLSVKAN